VDLQKIVMGTKQEIGRNPVNFLTDYFTLSTKYCCMIASSLASAQSRDGFQYCSLILVSFNGAVSTAHVM
jgi:hypothetical protein